MKSITGTLGTAAFAFALLALPLTTSAQAKLGIQSWTLRNLNFDQVVEFAVKHQIMQLQLISGHMDPMAPIEESLRKKAILDRHGLAAYTFGVAGTSLDQAQNRRLFEFAKAMGIKLIVVEPGDFKILDLLEELVKEFDIRIAIHNHGITSMYGNPLVVRALLKHRDPRMGVCLDIGWVTSARFDAAKVFTEYDGRVFDIHLKDKKVNNTPKGDVATDTKIGEGDANHDALFAALKHAKWNGVLAIETDSGTFAGAPAEFVDGAKQVFEKAFAR